MNKLIFNQSASKWEEATPLGNGFLGAMIYGQTDKELIYMNEDSLYSGGPINRINPDTKKHLQEMRNLLLEGHVEKVQQLSQKYFYSLMPHPRHYQPLGQVWVEWNQSEVTNYQRVLDMNEAISYIDYFSNDINFHREYFISYPDNVFVYKISNQEKKKFSFDLYLTRRSTVPGHGVSYYDTMKYENDTFYLSGYNGNKEDGISYTMAVSVIVTDGSVKKDGCRLIIEDTCEAIIYVVGRTSYRSDDPSLWCQNHLNKIKEQDYDSIKLKHIHDYQKYYQKISLRLGPQHQESNQSISERLKNLKKGKEDLDLIETYFHFGRYLLIASSRENSLPANLQGIWNSEFDPPWGSKYTININIQMNYWMAEKMGLSNLHLPLMELQKKMLPRGQETAKHLYGCRGMCAHHNTDIWGDCAPADFYIPSTLWPMGSLWLSLHIIEHYQYTKDIQFMNEYFEILKQNALFLIDYMFKDKKGFYATGPSVSPENIYITEDGQKATVCMSPSMDIQIIKEFFNQYLFILDELERDDLRQEVEEHLKLLPPIQIGKHGQIMEWQEDYDEAEIGHRHISQLFALYPGNQIRYDQTPELAKAAYHTLERRLTHGGGHTGWSCAWIIHFFARLHEGEKAYQMLLKLLTNSTLDNLFDNHPPFQIDGNFGGANAILEMIVQDYGDKIFLLPAITEAFSQGELKGLRLKAGAIIDMQWNNSHISELKISAIRALSINVDWDEQCTCVSLDKNEIYQFKG